MSPTLRKMMQNFFAELLATFFVVSLICMGCVHVEVLPNSHFQRSINLTFAIMMGVQCFGGSSGAHFNPVVTMAAAINGLLSISMALVYFLGQILGAILACGLIKVIAKTDNNFCMTLPAESLSNGQAFLVEFVITSIFITTCCSVWDSRNKRYKDSVAIKLGLTVGGCFLAAGTLSGGSMNPVRSFSPALWEMNFDKQWIYWAAPFSSSLITSVTYKYCFRMGPNEFDEEL